MVSVIAPFKKVDRLIRALFLLLISSILCACAVQNPNELRNDHKGKIHFVVNRGYQEVYRKIVEYEEMPHQEMRSNLYTDNKRGKIYFKRAVTPFDSFVLIDIISTEPEVTEINYYYYFSAWKDLGMDNE